MTRKDFTLRAGELYDDLRERTPAGQELHVHPTAIFSLRRPDGAHVLPDITYITTLAVSPPGTAFSVLARNFSAVSDAIAWDVDPASRDGRMASSGFLLVTVEHLLTRVIETPLLAQDDPHTLEMAKKLAVAVKSMIARIFAPPPPVGLIG